VPPIILKLFLGALLALPFALPAQTYPSKPVRLVVPFPPGGGVDALGRIVGERLGTFLGQPVIVDNRVGAGGIVGTEAVAKAPADGYTLLVGSSGALAVLPSLSPALPYRPLEDLAPITMGVVNSNILLVRPSLPVTSVAELVALAKRQPGKLSYASGGIGTSLHLQGELLRLLAGIDIVHVPYKGTVPALNDLMGGQTDMMFSDPSALGLVKSGKLRALAQTAATRSPVMPDLPTMIEGGVARFNAAAWYAFFAPAGTPAPVLGRLGSEIVKALDTPEVKSKLATAGMSPSPSSPQELAALMREDIQRWSEVVKATGIKPGQ
jgi:tripartite-type tricarboxylate transporter receptor subunit TctC